MTNINDVNKEDKKVWIALSPDYANIGDIAISLAQEMILQEAYPNRKIVEFPMIDFFNYKKQICDLMNDDDIITIIGGGNMGNIYIEGEERRRDIISTFPNNKIISFPQSIDFENTLIGQKEFQTTIDVYGNHKNFTIFSREEKSHNIMKNNFNNEVKLVPDTVIYLTGKIEFKENFDREKVLICFRNDKEKITSKDITCTFVEFLREHHFNDIEITDTHLGRYHFEPDEKSKLLATTLKKFLTAKIAITDRLHGMIFALITKTPCIAFDNSNKKISSTYNTWLKDIPYIKVVDSFEELEILNSINELSKIDTNALDIKFDEKFQILFEELKNSSI